MSTKGHAHFGTSTSAFDIRHFVVHAPSSAGVVAGTKAEAIAIAKQTALEQAVYGYIQAVRALGRNTINTAEIAKALNIQVADVDGTVKSLLSKGVKLL